MPGNFQSELIVNDKAVELTEFPKEFVEKTIAGAVSSLKRSEDIRELEMTLNYGKVKLTLNGNPIPLSPFPTLILANTLTGMVSTLKGVEGKITNLTFRMRSA